MRENLAVMIADLREDNGGRITSCTPAFARMYGYTPRELIGQPVHKLIQAQHREAHAQFLQQYIQAPTVRVMGDRRIPGLCKDGSIVTKTLWIRDTGEKGFAAVEAFD